MVVATSEQVKHTDESGIEQANERTRALSLSLSPSHTHTHFTFAKLNINKHLWYILQGDTCHFRLLNGISLAYVKKPWQNVRARSYSSIQNTRKRKRERESFLSWGDVRSEEPHIIVNSSRNATVLSVFRHDTMIVLQSRTFRMTNWNLLFV